MVTKIASLMCNKFGGIRRINATFSNEFISASDMQNVELFNTGINSGVGIRTAKGNIEICNSIPSDEKVIGAFEGVQNAIKELGKIEDMSNPVVDHIAQLNEKSTDTNNKFM